MVNNKGRKHSKETIERIRIANTGRKYSKETIERMRLAQLGRKHSEATKLKQSAANSLSHPLRVINNKTGEVKLFTSIKQTAKFLGIHYSFFSKCLRKYKFYICKEYYITRI